MDVDACPATGLQRCDYARKNLAKRFYEYHTCLVSGCQSQAPCARPSRGPCECLLSWPRFMRLMISDDALQFAQSKIAEIRTHHHTDRTHSFAGSPKCDGMPLPKQQWRERRGWCKTRELCQVSLLNHISSCSGTEQISATQGDALD